jgi:Fe-S cluster assembly protein SufD
MAVAQTPFSAICSEVSKGSHPAWLVASRQAARNRVEANGLPTTRIESWRTTPLPDLGTESFVSGLASSGKAEALIRPFASEGVLFVFVDGLHSPSLSSPRESWPKGLRLSSVAELLDGNPEALRPWFEGAPSEVGAMHDLNTAAFRDGAFIEVDDGARISVEVRLLLVSSRTPTRVAQHVRNRVRLGEGAALRLTIAALGASDASGFTNNHTTVSLGPLSRLDLVRLHESPAGVHYFDALKASVEAGSILNDTVLQTGPSWTRSELDIALIGDGASADLGGVFVAQGRQMSDIHTILTHSAPRVVSRQNYRGLAADDARGTFHGQIKVEAGARGADATQSNKNMLLSKRAQIHSTPALEILTDDVKCKHGSATGQIDPAQLFYLRSRGIGPDDATRMLTRAFAATILSRLDRDATRHLIESQIAPSLEKLGVAA